MFGLVGAVFRLLDSYASRQEVFIHRSLSATLISSLDNILSISSSILIPPPDLAIPRIYSVLNLVLKEGVSSIPAVLILSTSETESTSIHINIIRPATGISTTIKDTKLETVSYIFKKQIRLRQLLLYIYCLYIFLIGLH